MKGKITTMDSVLLEGIWIKPTTLLKDIKGQQAIALTISRMGSKVTKSWTSLKIVKFHSIKETDPHLIGSLITTLMSLISESTLMKKTKGQYLTKALSTFPLKKSALNNKLMPLNGSKMSRSNKLALSMRTKVKMQCFVAYLLTKVNTL
jgi:hypothetical protein